MFKWHVSFNVFNISIASHRLARSAWEYEAAYKKQTPIVGNG